MRVTRTGVVAGMLLAVLVGDVAGLVHVSQQQEAERARQRAAAEAAWLAGVRAVATDLQLVRAPVSDAANLFRGGDVADAVRYDVYVRGAAAADLRGVGERLDAVAVPATRTQVQRELVTALGGMTDAARRLAEEDDPDVEDELDAFAAAAAQWDRVVAAEVATDLPTATTFGRTEPLTRTGQLFRWSSACAEATDEDEELLVDPEPGPEEVAVSFELAADRLEDLITALLEVPPAYDDAPEVDRDLEPALRGLRERVPALQQLAAALRTRDRSAGAEALVTLDRLAPLAETASRVFEQQGSTVCSTYFDAGVPQLQDEPADDTVST